MSMLVVQRCGEDGSLLSEVEHGVAEPWLQASGTDVASRCLRIVVLALTKGEVRY